MESKQAIAAALLSATALIGGCSSTQKQEIAAHKAKVGDVLVISEQTRVVLKKPFRAGTPNGLYDGAVTAMLDPEQEIHYEVNAVCSMPDLPGWPAYDNIYGKKIDTPSNAGKTGGKTEWQILLHFDGGPSNEGPKKGPDWAKRLAENLCRKGDFADASSGGADDEQKPLLEGKGLEVNNESTNQ